MKHYERNRRTEPVPVEKVAAAGRKVAEGGAEVLKKTAKGTKKVTSKVLKNLSQF